MWDNYRVCLIERSSTALLVLAILHSRECVKPQAVPHSLTRLFGPASGGKLVTPSGSSSAVERQLPKLDVAGSIPVSRSMFFVFCRQSRNAHRVKWVLNS